MSDDRLIRETENRHVIVAVHGFNVRRANAVRSYVALELAMGLTSDQVFIGVAWPGDGAIPIVNYPWEARDAMTCGRDLAAFLPEAMPLAAKFSFVSHSLGARLVLRTVEAMIQRASPPRIDEICLAAGAIDDNCLSKEFAAIRGKVGRISVLSSMTDKTLLAAFPLGDFVTDTLLNGTDSPWRGALGFFGPKPREAAPPVQHRAIPPAPGGIANAASYDHTDYFPPGKVGQVNDQWPRAAAYMRRAVNGEPDTW